MALTSTPRPEWAEPVATVASLGLVRNAIDGAGFLPSGAENGFGFSGIASDVADAGMFFPATRSSIRSASRVQPLATAAGRRYSFYSPEMSLLAESEIGISPSAPVILYEYVWFNGHPVAQVDGGVTHWTFTDHLGTPILQTDTNAAMFWRAEYEPFGRIYLLRTADQHQPLRLPGQEAEQFNIGPNGVTERSYNVFRWYRPGWGRYSQPDPLGPTVSTSLFSYVDGQPTGYTDRTGLLQVDSSCNGFGGGCACETAIRAATNQFNAFFAPGFLQRKPKCRQLIAGMGVPVPSTDYPYKPNSPLTPLGCVLGRSRSMAVHCSPIQSPGGVAGPPTPAHWDPMKVWLQPVTCNNAGIPGETLDTLFHEMLRNCGAPKDAGWFNSPMAYEISKACLAP